MSETPFIAKSEPERYGVEASKRGRPFGSKNLKKFQHIYVVFTKISSAPFQIMDIKLATNSKKAAKKYCEDFPSCDFEKVELFRV